MSEVVEKKNSLYEIVAQAQVIERAIAESGGELSPELEQALTQIDLSLTEKVEGYAQIMDRLESVSTYWAGKAAELSKISKGCSTVAAKIKDRLKQGMVELGKDEVFGESIRFKLTPTKGSLVISDASKLTDEYLMIETKKIPDKEKIRAQLESFGDVPGASLEGGYQLRKYAVKAGK